MDDDRSGLFAREAGGEDAAGPPRPASGRGGPDQPVAAAPTAPTRAELQRAVRALRRELEADHAGEGERPEALVGLPAASVPTSAGFLKVDGALARRLLRFNLLNRPTDIATIERYARLLLDGQYLPTGQAVSFDAAGRMTNGQQRLMALVATGGTASILVTFGMAPESVYAEDRPKIRTLGHDLWIAGDTRHLPNDNGRFFQAAIRILFHLEAGRLPWQAQPKVTMWDAREVMGHWPALATAAERYGTRTVSARLVASATVAFGALFLTADPVKGADFMERLTDTTGRAVGPTIKALQRASEGRRNTVAARASYMIRLVHAWDNFRHDREVAKLIGTLSERSGRAFPRVDGLRYAEGRLLPPASR